MKIRELVSALPECPLDTGLMPHAEEMGFSRKKYLTFAFIVSASALFLGMLLAPPGLCLPSALLFFAASAYALLKLPEVAYRKKISGMEAELPLALRTLGMFLEFGVPFKTALEHSAEGRGPLSDEMKKAVAEIRRGAGVTAAFSCLGRHLGSTDLKRALTQITSSYQRGGRGAEILAVADGLLSGQKHRMRMGASKQAVFSLLFIVITAVVPAFMLLFASLGEYSPFPQLSGGSFALLFLVLLPLISAALLAASSFFLPRSILGEGDFPWRSLLLVLAAALLFAALQLLSLPSLPVLLLILIAFSAFAYPRYEKERRREQLEEQLPTAVFSAAGEESRGLSAIFSSMADAEGPLGEEAQASLKQIKAKVKQEKVLEDFWSRNSSPLLHRFCTFLNHALHAGHGISKHLSLLANDMLSIAELRKERAQVLSMQKYTLVFGALIVPFILGSSLSLSSRIAEASSEPAPAGLSMVIPAYLVFYSLLASAFISQAEGKASSLYLYFVLLSLLSTSVFYVFSGISPV